ncbi:hypothetical protein [Salibacterium aidingense]|uniref:hypothetical protein n=1 Tax=Salibacterium aidingense TaxID=384933 RepID=UPI00041D7B9D|nr:hypothetical protein [Salibacterium aidingense]
MDEERKDIILKEIRYWKANQLLPDQYCNFLLMLYSEGEEADEMEDNTPSLSPSPHNFGVVLTMLLAAAAALILTFIVIYFTSFSLLLQTLSHLILAAFVFAMAFYARRRRDHILFHILISAGALLLFIGSTTTVMRFEENNILLHLTILFHCSVWLLAGFYWKLTYLKWAGAAGIILAVLFSAAS